MTREGEKVIAFMGQWGMHSIYSVQSVTVRIFFGLLLVGFGSGCVVQDEPLVPDNWDIRIVPLVTYFPHDTTWIFLDSNAMPHSLCRLWDSSRCMEGSRFQFNDQGHLESSETITKGSSHKEPVLFESYSDSNGKLIAMDYFPDTTTDTTASSKSSLTIERDTLRREFQYDSLDNLEKEYSLRNGKRYDSTLYHRDADGLCIALEIDAVKVREFERDDTGRLTRMLVTNAISSLQTVYRFDYRSEEMSYEPDPIWHHGLIPIWGY